MYKGFARVYDTLMADVDYRAWVNYYEDIFARFGLSPRLMLELGCGTGNVTLSLAEKGYEMIALDNSVEMLSVARGKALSSGLDILFLHQDMAEFELYGTVDAVVSALDCVNYIISYERVLKMLTLVRNYLNPGGIFIFDINSEFKLRHILGDNIFKNEAGGVFYTWENEFDPGAGVCRFYLTFFARSKDGRYDRIDEVQTQKAYGEGEILEAARLAGLEVLGVYNEFSFLPPEDESERIFFVLRRGA